MLPRLLIRSHYLHEAVADESDAVTAPVRLLSPSFLPSVSGLGAVLPLLLTLVHVTGFSLPPKRFCLSFLLFVVSNSVTSPHSQHQRLAISCVIWPLLVFFFLCLFLCLAFPFLCAVSYFGSQLLDVWPQFPANRLPVNSYAPILLGPHFLVSVSILLLILFSHTLSFFLLKKNINLLSLSLSVRCLLFWAAL